MRRAPRPRNVARGLLACSAATALLATGGCNTAPEEPVHHVLDVGAADSVRLWPPGMRYVRSGDQIFIEAFGLRAGYRCAERIGITSWNIERDTLGDDNYRLNPLISRPEQPRCGPDKGIDTLFRRAVQNLVGRKLRLLTPDGRATDSAVFINGSALVYIMTHVRATPSDTLSTFGRFTFRDSTAGRPYRTVHANTTEPCEFLQAGTWTRAGDTLHIRLRRILADTGSAALLPVPACTESRADTVRLHPNRYGFP